MIALLTGPAPASAAAVAALEAERIVDRKIATASTFTTATAGAVDITATTGDAPSITAVLQTSHTYRAVFDGRFSSSVAGDLIVLSFVEGGVTRRGSVLSATVIAQSLPMEWVFQPAAGTSTVYKVQCNRVAGTGTVSASASASTPLDFYIEDLGVTTAVA